MTIAGRNRARLVAICIAALILILSLISFVGIVLNGNLDNSLVTGTKSAESSGITEFILSLLRNNYNGYAVLISILAFPFLSLGFLIFVYFTFKKTHAIEISFFAMFTLCISFESIRLVFPLYSFSNIVLDSIANLSRLVYFFRLAGIMSIFMAGIFANKIITRKISSVFFFIFFISFLICLSMPINNFYISRYFLSDIKAGHSYIYLFLIAALLACVNYFFVYITKNIKEYLFAALSLTGALIGYAVLLYTSSYTLLGIGLALFILGNLSFIKYIHSYHIWQ
ncbi:MULTISPECIES: hypothetical protein [Treponema]|uniref:Membrane protein, putative n=1 Tax=Treponema denticola (strain ATCC 35405 / DSM 14222 / CIP 103919 / JCM 8153 / KCTC 15104) TaxID=243275 RepID=Q73MR3_TREDE|nr:MULTISPECIES: hypothetical protein [Treponema]AAS11962.1 membrane protein, putative [Treponema denticola ATCC 35405]EMB37033.1 hypothetical protein HMPREF9735_01595 [Treponema denticola ATCC 33521]EMB41494.1 hypothetical protein HMPREF9721_00238 [Treponema denticola ATCC 35404]EMB43235.1 hypothetical protein HMPREF9729_02223 [Treponema denticola ASLM]EMD56598.1 hypothetical protein HMPREF9728_01412 [Treponema denticola US-Trep]